jgi:tryptophan synthase alpha chain
MNRLAAVFDRVRAGRKMLCPFVTAGYPSLEATPEVLVAVQEGLGAQAGIIELGIPFSDPVADGPVIQASFTTALAKGCTVPGALAAVAAARGRGLTVPVVAMVSYSIVYKRGTREFARMCRENQLDGVILPDISLEEAPAIVASMREMDLRSTLLVAPTTPAGRREAIARLCDGFVYYQSVSGITGERKTLPTDIGAHVAALRQASPSPICVGFGISNAAHVRQVTREAHADGAIVGSALIRRMAQHEQAGVGELCGAVREFVAELALGLDA